MEWTILTLVLAVLKDHANRPLVHDLCYSQNTFAQSWMPGWLGCCVHTFDSQVSIACTANVKTESKLVKEMQRDVQKKPRQLISIASPYLVHRVHVSGRNHMPNGCNIGSWPMWWSLT